MKELFTTIKTIILCLALSFTSCKKSPKSSTSDLDEPQTLELSNDQTKSDDILNKNSESPSKASSKKDLEVTDETRKQYDAYLKERDEIHKKWLQASRETFDAIQDFSKNFDTHKKKWESTKEKQMSAAASEFSGGKLEADHSKQVTLHIHLVNAIFNKEASGKDASSLLKQSQQINNELLTLSDTLYQYKHNPTDYARNVRKKIDAKKKSLLGLDSDLDQLLAKYEQMYKNYCSDRKQLSKRYVKLLEKLTPIDFSYGYSCNEQDLHYIELFNRSSEAQEAASFNIVINSEESGFMGEILCLGNIFTVAQSSHIPLIEPYESVFIEIPSRFLNGNLKSFSKSAYQWKKLDHAKLNQTAYNSSLEMRRMKRPTFKIDVAGNYFKGDKIFPIKPASNKLTEKYKKEVKALVASEIDFIKSIKKPEPHMHPAQLEAYNRIRSEKSRKERLLTEKYRNKRDAESRRQYAVERRALMKEYSDQFQALKELKPKETQAKTDSKIANFNSIREQYLKLDKEYQTSSQYPLTIDATIDLKSEKYIKLRNASSDLISNSYQIITDIKSCYQYEIAIRKDRPLLPGESIYIPIQDKKGQRKLRGSTYFYTKEQFNRRMKNLADFITISTDTSHFLNDIYVINSN